MSEYKDVKSFIESARTGRVVRTLQNGCYGLKERPTPEELDVGVIPSAELCAAKGGRGFEFYRTGWTLKTAEGWQVAFNDVEMAIRPETLSSAEGEIKRHLLCARPLIEKCKEEHGNEWKEHARQELMALVRWDTLVDCEADPQ